MTISFWLILLAVVAFGLLHSLLASLTTKARTRKWIDPTADRWFRIAYNLIAVVTLLREFGEAYADYRGRTPMLIPGLKLLRSKNRS